MLVHLAFFLLTFAPCGKRRGKHKHAWLFVQVYEATPAPIVCGVAAWSFGVLAILWRVMLNACLARHAEAGGAINGLLGPRAGAKFPGRPAICSSPLRQRCFFHVDYLPFVHCISSRQSLVTAAGGRGASEGWCSSLVSSWWCATAERLCFHITCRPLYSACNPHVSLPDRCRSYGGL